jgi:hypothetical protein
MTLPEITWTGSNDDFTAICGEYILRVEQMERKMWWYCVYFQGFQISIHPCKKSQTEAKQAAEIEFYKHYIQQI